jgi:hypothetical protein
LIDGAGVKYSEESDTLERRLTMPFKKGNNQIRIIGTQLFGVSFSGISKAENTVKLLLGGGIMKSKCKIFRT